jgi:hypothetical protein
LTEADIAELATVNRRTLLDTIEGIRGTTPDEPNMVAYDFTVPIPSHLLAMEDKGDGFNLWSKLLNRSRKVGNHTAPQMADVAQVTILNLNDLERQLKARLPEILRGEPNTLTGAQRLAVVDSVLDWLPEYDNTLSKAQHAWTHPHGRTHQTGVGQLCLRSRPSD